MGWGMLEKVCWRTVGSLVPSFAETTHLPGKLRHFKRRICGANGKTAGALPKTGGPFNGFAVVSFRMLHTSHNPLVPTSSDPKAGPGKFGQGFIRREDSALSLGGEHALCLLSRAMYVKHVTRFRSTPGADVRPLGLETSIIAQVLNHHSTYGWEMRVSKRLGSRSVQVGSWVKNAWRNNIIHAGNDQHLTLHPSASL